MISSLQSLSTCAKRMVNSIFAASLRIESTLALKALCVVCLTPTRNDSLCGACQTALPANACACLQCALPLPETMAGTAAGRMPATHKCGPCHHRSPAFDRTIAPWRYEFPVSGIIGRFKYGGQRAYGQPLARGLAGLIAARAEPLPELLIPVPMHPRKLRRRGFNQSEEVAHWLSRQLRIPVSRRLLLRIHQSDAQSTLRRRQRLKNLKGAFRVTDRIPSHVALIDDVMTTGATAEELSRLLKKNGAREVEVWVLARTPMNRKQKSVRSAQCGEIVYNAATVFYGAYPEMTDRKQFTIVMLVAAIFVGWLVWRGVEVISLNDALQEDKLLTTYPYHFRVLRVDGKTAVMSSPRSFNISTHQALTLLFPELRTVEDNDRKWLAAKREFAQMQARAGQMVVQNESIDRVRWELDENWYHLNELKDRRFSIP